MLVFQPNRPGYCKPYDSSLLGLSVRFGMGIRPRLREHVSMQDASRFVIVLVTAPDLKTARTLAQAALEARLIACANLVPQLESHYWWQGRIESGAEVLLVLKTAVERLAALEELVLARHPYDTPEIVTLPLAQGTARYLEWLDASLSAPPSG